MIAFMIPICGKNDSADHHKLQSDGRIVHLRSFDFQGPEIVHMDEGSTQKLDLILIITIIHRYLYEPLCQGPHTKPINILVPIITHINHILVKFYPL